MDLFSSQGLHAAVATGEISTVKTLLKDGADVNTQNEDGLTPVMIAIDNGQIEIARYLIEYAHADLSIKTFKGQSITSLAIQSLYNSHNKRLVIAFLEEYLPLEAASLLYYTRRGDVEKIKACLASGIDVNTQNEDSLTPVMLAINNGRIEIARYLIEYAHADLSIKTFEGQSITSLAIQSIHNYHNKRLVIAFLEKYLPLEAASLLYYTRRGDMEKIKACLASGIDVNTRDQYGNTLLMIAIQESRLTIAKFLIVDAGADINATGNDKTPLMIAEKKQHPSIVEYLEKRGVKRDTKTSKIQDIISFFYRKS